MLSAASIILDLAVLTKSTKIRCNKLCADSCFNHPQISREIDKADMLFSIRFPPILITEVLSQPVVTVQIAAIAQKLITLTIPLH